MNRLVVLNFVLIFFFMIDYGYANQKLFSEDISSMWLQGKKQEVLKIAIQRLAKNEKDLSALLLKMDYEVAFLEIDNLAKTIDRVLFLSKSITTPKFGEKRSLLEADIEIIKQLIPKITKEMIAQEKHKGDIPNKPLPSLIIIQALEADGLVLPLSKNVVETPKPPSSIME
jgi:hypothetical protein